MNANAKRWVATLRSGRFTQGRRALNTNGQYCCLGVACELYREEFGEDALVRALDYENRVTYNGEEYYPPERVREWLGLATRKGEATHTLRVGEHAGDNLGSLNDEGATFEEIAILLEEEPEGLFL